VPQKLTLPLRKNEKLGVESHLLRWWHRRRQTPPGARKGKFFETNSALARFQKILSLESNSNIRSR